VSGAAPVPDGPLDNEEVLDRGLQNERTYLSWQRTGLSYAAVGALLLHGSGGRGLSVRLVPGMLALVAAATLMLRAYLHYRGTHHRVRQDLPAVAPRLIAGVAALTAGLALGGLVLQVTWR